MENLMLPGTEYDGIESIRVKRRKSVEIEFFVGPLRFYLGMFYCTERN